MKMINLFATPIYITEINFNFQKVVDYVLNLKNNCDGRRLSNNGWQSFPIEDNIDIFQDILDNVNTYCKSLSFKNNQKFSQIWANVNGYKDFNMPHKHLNANFSGVLYVQTPKNSGKIVFKNNNEGAPYLWNDLERTKNNKENSFQYEFEPRAGDLYLFPAWAEHYVEQNLTNQERISLSFDTIEDKNVLY